MKWNKFKGFSLLEVMVAMAIMATAFSVLLATQSGNILLSERAEYMTKGVMLARQKMTELEMLYHRSALPINDKKPEIYPIDTKPFGDEYPEYGYSITLSKVTIPLPKSMLQQDPETPVDPNLVNSANYISELISKPIRELRVEVFWESPAGEDRIEVITHLVDLEATLQLPSGL